MIPHDQLCGYIDDGKPAIKKVIRVRACVPRYNQASRKWFFYLDGADVPGAEAVLIASCIYDHPPENGDDMIRVARSYYVIAPDGWMPVDITQGLDGFIEVHKKYYYPLTRDDYNKIAAFISGL